MEPEDTTSGQDPAENSANGDPDLSHRQRAKALIWSLLGVVVLGLAAWAVKEFTDNINTHRVETAVDRDAIESKDNLGGGDYLIPAPIQDVGPPPIQANTCNGRYKWAHEKGGVDVSATLSRVTITAESGHQVQVVGARRVHVGERKNPAVGSVLTCPGRGAAPVRHLYINLDTDEKAYYDGESDQPQELNFAVEGGTTAVLDVLAQTELYDWSYKIELILRVDGKEVVETIDNGGKPFRTTAAGNARQYQWIEGDWFDITEPGQQIPEPKAPVNIPNACTLLTAQEVSDVLGQPFTVESDFPAAPATSGDGRIVVTTFCVHSTQEKDLVQITLTDAGSPEEAQKEFDYELRMSDPNGVAEDFPGYSEAKQLEGPDVMMLRDTTIIRLNITRQGNKIDPLDVKYMKSLVDIVAPRI